MRDTSKDVDAYLASLEPERKAALEQLRSLIQRTVPEAVESMQYRMPTYNLGGEMLCAFASQKRYMSLYMDTGLVEAHRGDLQGLDVGKSCIRFKRLEQLPLPVVEAILKQTVKKREPA